MVIFPPVFEIMVPVMEPMVFYATNSYITKL